MGRKKAFKVALRTKDIIYIQLSSGIYILVIKSRTCKSTKMHCLQYRCDQSFVHQTCSDALHPS